MFLQAYHLGEDGLACVSDESSFSALRFALWNDRDSILGALVRTDKQRGYHGKDVKEYYFYLGNTPTHSYMKYLYKYPQADAGGRVESLRGLSFSHHWRTP